MLTRAEVEFHADQIVSGDIHSIKDHVAMIMATVAALRFALEEMQATNRGIEAVRDEYYAQYMEATESEDRLRGEVEELRQERDNWYGHHATEFARAGAAEALCEQLREEVARLKNICEEVAEEVIDYLNTSTRGGAGGLIPDEPSLVIAVERMKQDHRRQLAEAQGTIQSIDRDRHTIQLAHDVLLQQLAKARQAVWEEIARIAPHYELSQWCRDQSAKEAR